ncbi:hypothetical protein RHDE110596_23770 [Prescottella defluvii]
MPSVRRVSKSCRELVSAVNRRAPVFDHAYVDLDQVVDVDAPTAQRRRNSSATRSNASLASIITQ